MSVIGDSVQNMSMMSEDFDEMDPTILDGYKIKFNKEVRLNFKADNSNSKEYTVRFRVFTKKQDTSLEEVRIEMTMDEDVCLFVECNINENDFQTLKKDNNLRVEFQDFARSVIELLERSVKKSTEFSILFTQDESFGGELVFLQKLKLRLVTVFSLHFSLSDEEFIRKQVQYRFNRIKNEKKIKETEINTQFQKLNERNPSLARQLQNSVTATLKKRLSQ